MKYIDSHITIDELKEMSTRMFGGMVKAVVDIEKKVMVVDAGMHADQEQYLLEHGSKQENLWGINFYPDETDEDFLEFDSMINIRPQQKNFSRNIEDEAVRKMIYSIVNSLVRA